MNAPYISEAEFIADNARDSDSDNSDGIPDYYQPISSSDGDLNEPRSNGYHPVDPNSDFSYSHDDQAVLENGIRYLDQGEDQDRQSEEEEEESRRVEADLAMRRAFEEDESRRNAPLTAENATRVMEAMRGVSFAGLPPDWAGHISEDSLFDQLQRSRRPPHSAA